MAAGHWEFLIRLQQCLVGAIYIYIVYLVNYSIKTVECIAISLADYLGTRYRFSVEFIKNSEGEFLKQGYT